MPRAKDIKRSGILAAASRLFDSKPYHEVRVEDVAAEAQVSKGTVYTYFDSKEHLYLSIMSEGALTILTGIEAIAADTERPVVERLMDMVDGIVRFALAYPEVYRLQHAGAINLSSDDLTDMNRRAWSAMNSVIVKGVADGVFEASDGPYTYFMITGFVGEVIKFDPRPKKHDELVAHVRQVVLHGLLKRTSA